MTWRIRISRSQPSDLSGPPPEVGAQGTGSASAAARPRSFLQDAVDRARLPAAPRVAVLSLAPRGDHRHVAAHHRDLGPGPLPRAGVAGQQDLDVDHLEAERFDRFADQRDGPLEPALEENLSLGRRDQVAGSVLRADVVDIADVLVGGERLRPVGLAEGRPALGVDRDRERVVALTLQFVLGEGSSVAGGDSDGSARHATTGPRSGHEARD